MPPFKFVGKKVKVELAPPEIKAIQPQQEEFLDKKPSTVTTQMFKDLEREVSTYKSTAPIVTTEGLDLSTKKEASESAESVETAETAETASTSNNESSASTNETNETNETEDELLDHLEELLTNEQKKDPYVNEIPIYVPETRRGFSEFIKQNYSDFMLKKIQLQEPETKDEKYLYQQFIREYIRQASPYRGLLVYHGLGSGKTCSAIAASEALFAIGNKRIIVMTPFSLRKNFLKEITFCGFRHFRLQNYWIDLDIDNEIHKTFAREVLNIGENHLKKAGHIWVPDFDKTESNYNLLSSDQQTEIRNQILSILVYDSKTNPTGRIEFINYNGISAAKLKEIACTKSTYFDNAVIVIDEIHNLVRLMTGKIEPYITSPKGAKRKIVVETIGAEKWKPSLCDTNRNYKRGYLFFRLLLSATNSKIIGLSGTPLINFPEELGVLTNILHGFIPVVEGVVAVSGDEIQERIKNILLEYQYVDFVRVESDRAGQGIRFMISLLPEGIRKISNDVGVERIPEGEGESVLKQEDILKDLNDLFQKKGYKFSSVPVLKALPLLPIINDDFRSIFMNEAKTEIINKAVLLKRLSGMISYYKGSNQNLMPKVLKDEVIRVSMSEYQQKKYSLERSQEIALEKNKKSKKSDIWADIDNIGEMKNSTSYRMGSRQVCNFAFPPSVTRPRPNTSENIDFEAPDTKDIIDGSEGMDDGDFAIPENPEEDEHAVYEEESEGEGDEIQEGGDNEDEDELIQIKPLKPSKPSKIQQIKLQRQSDCKAGKKKDETYKDAILRSKKCLVESPRDLEIEGGLRIYSPKYSAILNNIQNASGSSLVYSQFLDMEGIGIFRLVMDINGYAPIEIESTQAGPRFSKNTEESFKNNRNQPRYITFSGSEKEDIRRLALDVFNARFNELPENLSKVLLESGFEENNNKKGQICRVFCITSAGAEGISLKNVRAVHIMEPYWNDVRLKQVKGRAIRIGSHLDLPPKERNVSIYTYISVFGPEAQNGEPPMKIDETISIRDSMDRKEAISYDLPIGDQKDYVVSSDEYLYLISKQKKKIIDELETIMKSSAIDCELNYAENKDGTFECLSLKGKVGDFLYHPNLQTDILESASQFKIKKAEKTEKKVRYFTYKTKRYAATDSEGKFNIYDAEDLDTLIGTMESKDGKPIPPIRFL